MSTGGARVSHPDHAGTSPRHQDHASPAPGQDGPDVNASRPHRSHQWLLMGVALVAGAICLGKVVQETLRTDRQIPSYERPGSGVILDEEAAVIWLPEEWITLAASSSSRELVQSPEALRTHLTKHGQEDVWYVLFLKGHQANGKTVTRPFQRVPGRQQEHFEEFREVLATAAGRPRWRGIVDYSTAQVMPIPDELRDLDPQQAYDKLGSRRFFFP